MRTFQCDRDRRQQLLRIASNAGPADRRKHRSGAGATMAAATVTESVNRRALTAVVIRGNWISSLTRRYALVPL